MVTITTHYIRVIIMSSLLLMAGGILISTLQATLVQSIKTYTSKHFTIRWPVGNAQALQHCSSNDRFSSERKSPIPIKDNNHSRSFIFAVPWKKYQRALWYNYLYSEQELKPQDGESGCNKKTDKDSSCIL